MRLYINLFIYKRIQAPPIVSLHAKRWGVRWWGFGSLSMFSILLNIYRFARMIFILLSFWQADRRVSIFYQKHETNAWPLMKYELLGGHVCF